VEEMKKNFIIILVLLFLTVFISGCIGFLTTPGEDSIAPGEGRLEIYLTDSSGDYKAGDDETYSEVNITISEIKVHLAGEGEEAEGEWIEWELSVPTEFNLVELKDVLVLLSEGELEGELASGKYTQIRLFVIYASVLIEPKSKENKLIDVATNGEPVEIPSALQTGIKLIHPFEINGDDDTILIIDFDAEKSIVKTGNGEYKLQPVIKVITGFTDEDGEEE
jgi:hypothetical protein